MKEPDETRDGTSARPKVSRGVRAGLMLALFAAALDATVVSTAMPAVAESLGGAARYSWPLTSYLLTCTVTTLLAGGLVGAFGHRRMYAAGIVLFAVSSVLCALAPSMEALALWRAVEGIGGGILESGVFIAAADLFEPRERGAYLGMASAMYGLASIVGPVLGGVVAQALSWHWIFIINVPVGVAALVLAVRCLPERLGGKRVPFDIAGALVATACVVPLTLAFSLAGDVYPLGSMPFFALIGISLACMVALAVVERAREQAVVPMRILGRPVAVAGFVAGFAVQYALYAGVVFLPRFAQDALGLSGAMPGFMLVPMTLALMVGSNTAGALFRAHGRLRQNSLSGFVVIIAASIVAALCFSAGFGAVAVACTVAVMGFGIGLAMPTSNLAAQIGAEPRDMGRATSLSMFFRGFGGTVSSAVCGMLASSGYVGAALPVYAVAAFVAVVGAAASLVHPRRVARG